MGKHTFSIQRKPQSVSLGKLILCVKFDTCAVIGMKTRQNAVTSFTSVTATVELLEFSNKFASEQLHNEPKRHLIVVCNWPHSWQASSMATWFIV